MKWHLGCVSASHGNPTTSMKLEGLTGLRKGVLGIMELYERLSKLLSLAGSLV